MQRRLAEEKGRRLGVISDRLTETADELHLVADLAAGGKLPLAERQSRADTANKVQAALLQERDFIRRQSTWPWDTSTFRAVTSAVLLPVVLFLLTRLLERVVF